jgi:peptidoglycan/LPS O-acetylase OafA/YrhL
LLETPKAAVTATNAASTRFRRDEQGLRAVAVCLVILAHAEVPHFAGGVVGVDVFFVISGYVITGLLLRLEGSVPQQLLTFYSRRIRRIMPAATLTLLATLWATYHYPFGQRIIILAR